MIVETLDHKRVFMQQTRTFCPACLANAGELCHSDTTWIHSLRFALNPGTKELAEFARSRGKAA